MPLVFKKMLFKKIGAMQFKKDILWHSLSKFTLHDKKTKHDNEMLYKRDLHASCSASTAG